MNLLLFLAGQAILFFSFYKTCRLLQIRDLLITPLAIVSLSTYIYVFLYYGPTSIFAALGPEYLPMMRTHPWFYDPSAIASSFLAGTIQQVFPYCFCLLMVHAPNRLRELVSVRLDQYFAHPSNFCFGIAGTLIQAVLATLAPLWKDGVFAFHTPILPLKLVVAAFLLVTFSPQVSLIAYSRFRRKDYLRLAPWQVHVTTICSLLVGAVAFSAYSFRTYSIVNSGLILVYLVVALAPSRRLIASALAFLPFFALVAYLLTTLTSRINIQTEHLFPRVASNLQRELSYRSGFGNDSSIAANLQCINYQLDLMHMKRHDLLLLELATGLPKPVRDILYPNLLSSRLETLMQNCYAMKLGKPLLTLDLFDTKNEYFIVMTSNPFLGLLYGPLSWTIMSLCLILLVLKLPPFFSYGVAASSQILTFSSTPGEIISFFKILLIFSPIVFCLLTGLRKLSPNSLHS